MDGISRCGGATGGAVRWRAALGLWLGFVLAGTGCVQPDAVGVRGGSLDLNPRLRLDGGASAGMPNGRFFADGQCPPDQGDPQGALRECHFISTLYGSRVNEGDHRHLSRLRRSEYFWLEADSSPMLSYELVARSVTVINLRNQEVLAGPADVGTCAYFPVADPEHRRPIPGMEGATLPRAKEFLTSIDVLVQRCEGRSDGISERLSEQADNCAPTNVLSLVRGNPEPNARACVVNLPLEGLPGSNMARDASHSLVFQTANGAGLVADWPDVSLKPLSLLPHLKAVPVGGTRTVSRPLENTQETLPNADGSTTRFYSWQVPLGGPGWSENFSPNVVVQRVRIRKGDIDDPNRAYLSAEGLRAGDASCQVKDDGNGHSVFDIPMCTLTGDYRVTPAYRYGDLQQASVDDGDRLNWRVSLRTPPLVLADSDRLYIEFDLTALPGTGTTGSGLIGEPPGRNLGSIRIGATTNSRQVVVLRNEGAVSVWVDSVALAGRDAGEFGPVTIRRRVSGASPAASTPSAGTVSTPFIFRSGSSVEVHVSPAFQGIGDKQAEIRVNHRDVAGVRQPLRFPLYARAIAPDVAALPETVSFPQPPATNGYAQARKGALLVNNGPLPVRRIGVSLGGTDAAQFRLLSPAAGGQALVVQPGASEAYQIGYFPRATGVHDAELRIDTDEGPFMIRLHGICFTNCRQAPVATPANPGLVPVVPVAPVPRTVRDR